MRPFSLLVQKVVQSHSNKLLIVREVVDKLQLKPSNEFKLHKIIRDNAGITVDLIRWLLVQYESTAKKIKRYITCCRESDFISRLQIKSDCIKRFTLTVIFRISKASSSRGCRRTARSTARASTCYRASGRCGSRRRRPCATTATGSSRSPR
jgi:hypothetical protein